MVMTKKTRKMLPKIRTIGPGGNLGGELWGTWGNLRGTCGEPEGNLGETLGEPRGNRPSQDFDRDRKKRKYIIEGYLNMNVLLLCLSKS